ncbi:MAG: methyltransferase domain-containing protein [Paenibacillus sp.]|uniref:class I SAM-dependent methyltransferase n=1 Tax=Paenibacillus sp. TaxID=58172 RepID=UPI0025EFAA55|nr:class I SAM-dependent methyltransferase [Paenibacillus sp.]MBR2566529.1 methyltransferase domain-containing protein [Paenibacillus sp.]
MSMEWYDMIALRNGGYRSRARYIWEGKSAEELFEERLIKMLPDYTSVLDAGCGHGDFTLKMAAYTPHITGFDNSREMIRIAQERLISSAVQNVDFVCATTKEELPFQDEQFGFIYNRRGPTSIIEYGRLLPQGGVLFGIHTDVTKVRERLERNGYEQIEIEEYYQACMIFPDEHEFALFLADVPGNPDYTRPEYSELFQAKLKGHTIDGRILVREHKYIWKAVKA